MQQASSSIQPTTPATTTTIPATAIPQPQPSVPQPQPPTNPSQPPPSQAPVVQPEPQPEPEPQSTIIQEQMHGLMIWYLIGAFAYVSAYTKTVSDIKNDPSGNGLFRVVDRTRLVRGEVCGGDDSY